MTQRPSAYVLAGGLDEITPAMAVPKGRVIAVRNYESASTGYSLVRGYERYDGRQSPTDAFGLAPDGEQQASREAARAAIQRVPGSGPVRGVAAFNGQRYAWRNNADGTACVMHRATSAGWVAVDLGRQVEFTSGGTPIAEGLVMTGATSGATATIRRVVVTSGAWQDGDAAGYMVVSPISGAFVAENVNLPGLPDVATIAGAATVQSFPPGGRYYTENHNFYGASNLKEMYGCNGVGRGFAFDGTVVTFIRTGMPIDAPMRLRVHKKHLFFGFVGGSVQHSEPGNPLAWNAVFGAGEIALGSEITDLIGTVDALFMMTEDQINYLTGSDAQDWAMLPLSNEEGHGAIAHTVQNIGRPIYLDIGGFRSIAATQDYGNFRLGSTVPQIEPTLLSKRRSGIRPIVAFVSKSRDLYRCVFDDGSGVSIYFGRKYAEPMLFELGFVPQCVCVQLEADTGERTFMGGDDGFVYEMDVGTSYDGEEIEAYLQLPWDSEGSLDVIKRWHKTIIEMDATPDTQIGVMAEFDYGNGEQGVLPQQEFTVSGGGGLWNTVDWDMFFWSAPAEGRAEAYFDGQGENMSVIIVSRSAQQMGYTLNAIRKKFSVRGMKR